MKTKQGLVEVKRTVIDTVPIGYWLVTFEPIWGQRCNEGQHDDCMTHGCMDNEPDYIAEVDGAINKITRRNYYELGANGLTISSNTNDRYDDTHDLRPRLFKTKQEAKAHLEYTLKRFKNPQPWESFVQTA
jgi:hypothetical protein